MKDWVELGSTQRFWIQDPWKGDWEYSNLTTRPLSKIQNYTSVCSYIKIRLSSLDLKLFVKLKQLQWQQQSHKMPSAIFKGFIAYHNLKATYEEK